MSTRAMICVDWYGNECFELFYRHCDGYPTGLGKELIDAMLRHDSIEEVLKQVAAKPEKKSISKPEDAFLKYQGDLEWIYVIRNANENERDTVSLEVYKTSNLYTKRKFVWPVWHGYRRFLEKEKASSKMAVIELTACNTLRALDEFEKAQPGPGPEQSGTGNGPGDSDSSEQIRQYAACVFGPNDIVEVRRLPSGKSTWQKAGELAEVAEYLSKQNRQKQNIYAGVNPRSVSGGTKSKDVRCARCLFVDFDGINAETAKDRWSNTGLPLPTLTIASGHGIHAYWRLAEPISDMALWSKLQKKLIALLDSDPAIHDPARIMRLPGFTNHKQPIAMCRIIQANPERVCRLSRLLPVLNRVQVARRTVRAFDCSCIDNRAQNSGTVRIAKRIAAKWPLAQKGKRNVKAFQHAAFLVKNLRLTEDQAWPILKEWNCKNRPPLPEQELRQALRNAGIYGRHALGDKAAG